MVAATYSGALATWDAGKKLSVFGGWVNGENKFFDTSDDNAFLGGFKYKFNKRLYLGYSALIGKQDFEPSVGGPEEREYFVQSLVVGYKPGKRWDYTFEWTLRNENELNGSLPDGVLHKGAYGINQELIYKFNKKWSVGARFEWAHDINGGMVFYPEANGDRYAFTVAANWSPNAWLTVRPELRYDKFDGGAPFSERVGGFPDGRERDKQFAGGVSAYVKF